MNSTTTFNVNDSVIVNHGWEATIKRVIVSDGVVRYEVRGLGVIAETRIVSESDLSPALDTPITPNTHPEAFESKLVKTSDGTPYLTMVRKPQPAPYWRGDSLSRFWAASYAWLQGGSAPLHELVSSKNYTLVVTCQCCRNTTAQRGSIYCADCERALFPQDYE